nr:MAG TPA: hypothetical protein [Caudoviricetes sp.]
MYLLGCVPLSFSCGRIVIASSLDCTYGLF